ncbi:nuclear transport factor 2 family protein [Ekhidna sp.]|uniref:nuclear transport factor 2 family protein n=1 Tax=Ekhidna sp. TaxID=2608089 RepID=UPI003B513CEC
MKALFKISILISAVILFASFIYKNDTNTLEVDAVKKLVSESYINGAFNELNTEAMVNGFHKDFSIYTAKGSEISKYPIDKWVEGVKKRKSNNYNPDDPKNVWDHNFAIVDVTGSSAQVKVELSNQGKLVYTDYLSLLKFDSGWKIVAKVYHKHQD